MENPENHIDWYSHFSNVPDNNVIYRTKYKGNSYNPMVDGDHDEFYIYSTCVAMRGEQINSQPECGNVETLSNDDCTSQTDYFSPATEFSQPVYTKEDVYESQLNNLTEQIKRLQAQIHGISQGDPNLNYEFKESNVAYNGDNGYIQVDGDNYPDSSMNHVVYSDEDFEEIVEEIHTIKKYPTIPEKPSNILLNADYDQNKLSGSGKSNLIKHPIDFNSKTIDESQFPPKYWSRLQSLFFKRFTAQKGESREVGLQCVQNDRRDAATLAFATKPPVRCVGVSVFPISVDIGLMACKPETREVGSWSVESDVMLKEWLFCNFPKLDDDQHMLIYNLLCNSIKDREEFVNSLLSLIVKKTANFGMQFKLENDDDVPTLTTSKLKTSIFKSETNLVSVFVEAKPELHNRSTFIDSKSGVDAGSSTEQVILRSQGTLIRSLPVDTTTCSIQCDFYPQSSHAGSDPIFSDDYIGLLNTKINQDGSCINNNNKIDSSKLLTKAEENTETSEETNTMNSHFFDPSLNKVSTFDGFSGSCMSSPRGHSSSSIPLSETYTVSSEKRTVDKVSKRHLIDKNVDLDTLVKGGKEALDALLSQGHDLGTRHTAQEFEPTVEVLHHVGKQTEKLDPSDLPESVTLLSSIESIKSSRPTSRFDDTTDRHPTRCTNDLKPGTSGDYDVKSTQSIPQPHVMSTAINFPVRNYKFTVTQEIKDACETLIGFYQSEQAAGCGESVKDKFLIVVRTWFEVAASAYADLLNVEDFIAILYSYSSTLLRDVIQSMDENDSTCLHYAVGHGAWQVVNLILDTGFAHPDHYNQSGFTALMIATISNASDSYALNTLNRLFSLGNVNCRTKTPASQTPLMLAALHGSVDVCILLLKHGAEINSQDVSGNTALMCAIEQEYTEVVQCFLEHNDVDFALKDNVGQDVLSIAESKNNLHLIELIKDAYHRSPSKVTSSTARFHLKKPTIELVRELQNNIRNEYQNYI